MKKILSSEIKEKQDVSEFIVTEERKCFVIVQKKVTNKRLYIYYDELYYPQFFYNEQIEKEILKRIQEMFDDAIENAIIIHYTKEYEKKINEIVIRNRLDFD